MKPTLPATISQMNYTTLEDHRQRYIQMNRLWAEMDINSDHYRQQRDETMAANTFIIDKIERHQQNRMAAFDAQVPFEPIWMAANDSTITLEIKDY